MKIGDYVRYTGEDTIIYQPGRLYQIVGYDEELDLYAFMSEADVAYLMPETLFEEVQEEDACTEAERPDEPACC